MLRRVAAFGVTLARLDIRQDAARHTEALAAITSALGLGSYADWDEAGAAGVPRCASCRPAPADPARSRRGARGAGRARHVPDDRRALRPGRSAPTSSRWRAARRTCSPWSCCRRTPALPGRCASCRCSRRRATCSSAGAVLDTLLGDPVVSRADRRPAGSDDRLLRFGQGRRPPDRRLGSLQGAGGRSSPRAAATASASRCSTAAAAASAAAAGRPTWRSSRSRPARSTARCA